MEISQITVHRQCLLKTILKWDNIFSHFLQSLKRVEWVDVIRSFRESKKKIDNFEYKHGGSGDGWCVCKMASGYGKDPFGYFRFVI